jgi:hypothetical protein
VETLLAAVGALTARGVPGNELDPSGDRAGDDQAADDPAALVGTALFALADLARRAGVEPESALRSSALAFRDRLVRAEQASTARTDAT